MILYLLVGFVVLAFLVGAASAASPLVMDRRAEFLYGVRFTVGLPFALLAGLFYILSMSLMHLHWLMLNVADWILGKE